MLHNQLFSLYNIVGVLKYPHAESAMEASYGGTMT